MIYASLPTTNIQVSKLALGTMTFGEQNTEKEAHQQLDYACSEGINFIDTAELYAIPIKKETQGLTEQYIGSWLKYQDRKNLIIASKIAGPNPKALQHLREGKGFSGKGFIAQAIDDSLNRLQTNYIDLYQLHWPERSTNFFGQLGYDHLSDDSVTDFNQVMATLKQQVILGKIRYIGLSNETPWGLMQYLKLSKKYDLPIVSIQNPYSLLNRVYEIGLAEMGIREHCGLLAYSPLGGGILSGKYLHKKKPLNARFSLWPNYFSRYAHENTKKATQAYFELAQKHGLSLTQMALAFVTSRRFLTSTIIGATDLSQLRENIASIKLSLNDELIASINEIHLKYPNPAP